MLVKTSLHDSQVMYWEPAKYVAKLRTLKTDNNPLLLVTNMQAGHGGASGRYDYLKEIAFDYLRPRPSPGTRPGPVAPPAPLRARPWCPELAFRRAAENHRRPLPASRQNRSPA
jgi:hypothetical protein